MRTPVVSTVALTGRQPSWVTPDESLSLYVAEAEGRRPWVCIWDPEPATSGTLPSFLALQVHRDPGGDGVSFPQSTPFLPAPGSDPEKSRLPPARGLATVKTRRYAPG